MVVNLFLVFICSPLLQWLPVLLQTFGYKHSNLRDIEEPYVEIVAKRGECIDSEVLFTNICMKVKHVYGMISHSFCM